VTGASRFLIGLVTCFATHDGIPAVAHAVWRQENWRLRCPADMCAPQPRQYCAAAGLLVTCEIVPHRKDEWPSAAVRLIEKGRSRTQSTLHVNEPNRRADRDQRRQPRRGLTQHSVADSP